MSADAHGTHDHGHGGTTDNKSSKKWVIPVTIGFGIVALILFFVILKQFSGSGEGGYSGSPVSENTRSVNVPAEVELHDVAEYVIPAHGKIKFTNLIAGEEFYQFRSTFYNNQVASLQGADEYGVQFNWTGTQFDGTTPTPGTRTVNFKNPHGYEVKIQVERFVKTDDLKVTHFSNY